MRSEFISVSGERRGCPCVPPLQPSVQFPSPVCGGSAAAVCAGTCGSAGSGRGRAVTLGERAVWAPVGAAVDLAREG